MRLFRSREDSLKFWLSFFFVAGSLVGSVFCNLLSADMKAELLKMEQQTLAGLSMGNVDEQRFLASVLWKRIRVLIFLLLIPESSAGERLRMAMMAYWGFSTAMMICPLTMGRGPGGFWNYLCLNIPHGIGILLIGYHLLWRVPLEEKHLTVGDICLMISVLCLSVAAETYINPIFLSFLFKN